jgi:hypothetical protein
MKKSKTTKDNKEEANLVPKCDWCKIEGEDSPKANFRFSVTDLDGVVLDTLNLCDRCCKRGVTFDGKDLDASD